MAADVEYFGVGVLDDALEVDKSGPFCLYVDFFNQAGLNNPMKVPLEHV